MTTANRNRLSLSALAAASSLIAFTAPAHAQSVCSATGTAVACTNGGATTTLDGTAVLGIAPSVTEGLSVTSTAPLSLAVGGTLNTTNSPALVVLDTGGDLTVSAATGGAVNLITTGTGPGAILVSSTGKLTATLGSLNTTGPWSLFGVGATGATVTTGAVTATNVALSPVTLFGVRPIAAGALVVSPTGAANLTVNGNVAASGAVNTANSLLVAAATFAPAVAGTATTTVNGTVTTTNTDGDAVGAAAVGGAGATVTTTGAVLATGTIGATGLAALGTVDGSTASGTATVTAGGNVTARAQDATGIFALGTTVNISAPNAIITATDTDVAPAGTTDAVGVEANAVNALTINVGQVVSSGDGVRATTTGGTSAALNVTTKGITAGTNGIIASASGATPITITATAPITVAASGGFGIAAVGGDGLVTVNEAGVTGAAGGVVALASGTGSVAVNATGGTTTATAGDAIRALAPGGSATVTVASGATVTGQGANNAIFVASGTGTGQSSTVNINGTVNNSGTGASLRAVGGPATVNLAGTLSGPVVLSGANDVLNVNAGGTLTAAAIDFGAGADTLKVNSGGTLSLSPTSAFTGLELLNNAGTVRLAAGTNSLAGVSVFTNTGTVSATGGATVLTGQPTFTNNGTISMVDGQPNDTLTLGTVGSPTNFVGGAGSRLAVDVTPTASDQLVITGNASGSTVISPSFVGGAAYNPVGVTVVTTGGTVAGGAFTIDPTAVAQGWLNAGLTQTGGVTRLTTRLDSSVADLAQVRSMNQDMWYQSFDAWDDAVRGRHAGSLTTGQPIGIWGQLYRSRDRHGDSGAMTVTTAAGNVLTYTGELKTDRGGAQVGLEFRGPGFVIGATGGYEWANNRDQPTPAVITGEGHNWGLYALAGMDNGLYAGVLYKRDNLDLKFINPARGVAAYYNDAYSEGVDGEVGLKGNAGAIGFDLQGGLSWVKTRTGTFQDQGLYMSWDNNRSLRGRLGGRVIFPQAWGAYLGAKVIHEFKDPAVFRIVDAATGASAADIVSPNRGTWVRLEAGIDSFGIKGALLSVWGDVGETKSLGARLGFRF